MGDGGGCDGGCDGDEVEGGMVDAGCDGGCDGDVMVDVTGDVMWMCSSPVPVTIVVEEAISPTGVNT